MEHAINIEELEGNLKDHYALFFDEDEVWKRAQKLRREGYIKLTDLLPVAWMDALRDEAKDVANKAARRIDITVEATGHTPRRMGTVNFDAIMAHGKLIPRLYFSPTMRDMLSRLAEVPIYDCDFTSERLTMTKQEQVGDTHGWHWGDYQYALIFIIEAPPIEAGGMLQCVPHTRWDKSNPQIHRHLVENPIHTYYHKTGDIYFFKTDTTLHRTYPLTQDGTRIILNFTYAGPDDLNKHHSHETQTAVYDW